MSRKIIGFPNNGGGGGGGAGAIGPSSAIDQVGNETAGDWTVPGDNAIHYISNFDSGSFWDSSGPDESGTTDAAQFETYGLLILKSGLYRLQCSANWTGSIGNQLQIGIYDCDPTDAAPVGPSIPVQVTLANTYAGSAFTFFNVWNNNDGVVVPDGTPEHVAATPLIAGRALKVGLIAGSSDLTMTDFTMWISPLVYFG